MNKIRVLIVDDSLLIRKVLTEILSSSPDIEVVGGAEDPYIAREMIKELNPDVLTLDIEMPRMDGITFLRNLMRLRPMPVVMISALTESNAEVTLTALELGAVDFIAKPTVDVENALNDYAEDIIAKVRVASQANIRRLGH
ncbi:response regulator [Methylobacter sp.]|uniref:response regulator n=1 Tax=Methylobacter sp. TaxID=2051955 RepID=UPI00120688C2|nr:MAG: response regulator [Methylobacter sp.]